MFVCACGSVCACAPLGSFLHIPMSSQRCGTYFERAPTGVPGMKANQSQTSPPMRHRTWRDQNKALHISLNSLVLLSLIFQTKQ